MVIFYCFNVLKKCKLPTINVPERTIIPCYPDTIILILLLSWNIKFEKRKELKKIISEKLMQIAWHPNRWIFCVSDYEKKRRRANLY